MAASGMSRVQNHGAERAASALAPLQRADPKWLMAPRVDILASRRPSWSSSIQNADDSQPTAGPQLPSYVPVLTRCRPPGIGSLRTSAGPPGSPAWVAPPGHLAATPMRRGVSLSSVRRVGMGRILRSVWIALSIDRGGQFGAAISNDNKASSRVRRRPDRQIPGWCRNWRQHRCYSRIAVPAVWIG
jgi:hypothetical protein